MSKYHQVQTEFTSKAQLLKALQVLKVPVDVADGNVLALYGYQGDRRPEQASIVIRRQHIDSAANDLGFAWDGQVYAAVISEYDAHNRGQQMLLQVQQEYGVLEAITAAEAQGYTVERKQVGADVELVLVMA